MSYCPFFGFCTLQFCKCDISESIIGRGSKLLAACRVHWEDTMVKIKKKFIWFFLNKCCLNIVPFSLIFCNCYIIVFSLVDFKPGDRGFKSRLCQKKFLFLLFLFWIHRECFWFKYCPSPPPTFFFYFLNIVQYLFAPCTIPSTLGSHPPYPTSPPTPNNAFTSTLTRPPHQPDPPPTWPPSRPPPLQKIFFFNFPPTNPPRPPPLIFFFFEFSQIL